MARTHLTEGTNVAVWKRGARGAPPKRRACSMEEPPGSCPYCAAPLVPTQAMGGCHPAEAEGTTTRAGVEHRSPGTDAPRVPLVPHIFTGVFQPGARNGSTWGLHAPLTPFLVPPHPLLTFTSPQQQEEKGGGSTPRCTGCLWPMVPSGGWGRCWCLLNIASSCPRGRITQQFVLDCLLPVLPGSCGDIIWMGASLGSGMFLSSTCSSASLACIESRSLVET